MLVTVNKLLVFIYLYLTKIAHTILKQKLPLLYYTTHKLSATIYYFNYIMANGGETFKDGLMFFTWQRNRISLNQLVVIVFEKDLLELCFVEFLLLIFNSWLLLGAICNPWACTGIKTGIQTKQRIDL